MTFTTTLDEKDMRSIIASHFKVNEEDVRVTVKEEYEGYCPMEHKIYRASCTITHKGGFPNG